MNLNEIKNKLDACSSVEQINVLKRETMEKIDREHAEKMNRLNEMKINHEVEQLEIEKKIKEALASKDFIKVQDLLKKQAEIITRQSAEMLSIM